MNVKIFNMITGINESNYYIFRIVNVDLMVKNAIYTKNKDVDVYVQNH